MRGKWSVLCFSCIGYILSVNSKFFVLLSSDVLFFSWSLEKLLRSVTFVLLCISEMAKCKNFNSSSHTYDAHFEQKFVHRFVPQTQSISSRPDVFYNKGVLRNLARFTGRHLCQSLFFNKVAGLRPAILLKMRLGTGVFLWILWNF